MTLLEFDQTGRSAKKNNSTLWCSGSTDTLYIHAYGASNIYPVLLLDNMVPLVALSSVVDENTALNAGFSINTWRPSPYITLIDSRPGGTAPLLTPVFDSIVADVAVRDKDARFIVSAIVLH